VRHGTSFLVAVHLPFVAYTLWTITRLERRSSVVVMVLVGLALGGVQLRHSLAVARGGRPQAWPWTLTIVALLVYVPMWWCTWLWWTAQWFVIASAAMLLRGRLAGAIAAGPIIATTFVAIVQEPLGSARLTEIVYPVYVVVILVMGAAALYGSAQLVRAAEGLDRARTELAELAVGRERLRLSRDLHDVLGQSLTAVSLKGDLALRLLAIDAEAARAEIEGLTQVARGALRDARAVTRAELAVSLRDEVDSAEALLRAAGIEMQVDVDLSNLERAVEVVLAWAVRETTTNVLRHSDAKACSIRATRADSTVRLEVVNDGAPLAGGIPGDVDHGCGLAGLAERAEALSGQALAQRTQDGQFSVVVVLPVRTAEAVS
jgi:two-component system sensor histidine kinase DesK